MSRRRIAGLAARPLVAALLLVACGGASAAPIGVAGMPDLTEYLEMQEPPDDLPGELLELREAEREADRLLARTRRTQNLCGAMDQLEALDEPSPDDPEELLAYGSQYLSTLQAIDPTGRVKDPEDQDDRIEVPDEIMENLATQEQAIFAYVVRVSFISALQNENRLSASELQERLDHAFVQLVQSAYTDADRELVAVLPQYC